MRRRRLSGEERALWDRIAARYDRIRPDRAPLTEAPSEPPPEPVSRPRLRPMEAPSRVLRPSGPALPQISYDLEGEIAERLDRPQPGMDRRTFEKIRRGKVEVEGRIDLHGMTSVEAHSALKGFIYASHSAGKRLVLVITGKGKPRPEDAFARPGILRHAVPEWLRLPPIAALVMQVTPSHRRHGGSGAYYVYLRRKR